MWSALILFAEDSGSGGGFLGSLLPFLLIIPLFYLLILRPQRRMERERQSLIANTKKNDKVVTTSGIIGTVVQFTDDELVIQVDDKVRLRMVKGSIARNVTQEEALKAAQANAAGAKQEASPQEQKASK